MSQSRSTMMFSTPLPGQPHGEPEPDLMARPEDAQALPRHRGNIEVELEHTRRECESLRGREKQIMDLLGCRNPDRLVHDLRNVLNELQLLRLLADLDNPRH